jgi:glycosyltransferase involved in cell wall biosynthesis
VRIAILYDCLYPHTVGGVERWYRSLAERLAARHEVTYLTRRQWALDQRSDAPRSVRVVAVSGGRRLYTPSGRRRVVVPLRFGWGTFWHLLRHRRDYDVIHTCGFPYFSLLAARLACLFGGPPIVTDWLEVWTRDYWREYLGPLGGHIGAAVQRLCIGLTDCAVVFSHLQAARLVNAGYRRRLTTLKGMYDRSTLLLDASPIREPLVVYVGRHIPEKHVLAIPAAIAAARQRVPELRATIFGDGPERARVVSEVQRMGLRDVIGCPGFVPWEEIDDALRRAACLLMPSRREGYGLVIVEAAARGTPSIIVRGPDNAATELIEENENGFVVESADPDVLARAIEMAIASGPALVQRTQAWFGRNAERLTIDASIAQLEALYDAIAQ